MKTRIDPRALTRELLAFNTINPPGMERACASHLGAILEAAGLPHGVPRVRRGAHEPRGRDRRRPRSPAHLLHRPHRHRPAGRQGLDEGRVRRRDGRRPPVRARLHRHEERHRGLRRGRGRARPAPREEPRRGARHHRERGDRLRGREVPRRRRSCSTAPGPSWWPSPRPTIPYVGHKGLVWFEIETTGVTAHGSMPEVGDNAINRMARVIGDLEHFRFPVEVPPGDGEARRSTWARSTAASTPTPCPTPRRSPWTCAPCPGIDHGHLCHSLERLLGPRGAHGEADRRHAAALHRARRRVGAGGLRGLRAVPRRAPDAEDHHLLHRRRLASSAATAARPR